MTTHNIDFYYDGGWKVVNYNPNEMSKIEELPELIETVKKLLSKLEAEQIYREYNDELIGVTGIDREKLRR